MFFSTFELDLITNEASNLAERLSGMYEPLEAGGALGSRRLARWKEVAAGTCPQHLAVVLSGQTGFSEARLLALLGAVKHAPGVPSPAWALFLGEIAAHLAASVDTSNGEAKSNAAKSPRRRGIPYEHLFWPIAELAWGRVAAGCPQALTALAGHARAGFQHYLVQRLSDVASAALHPAFLAQNALDESGMMQHVFGRKSFGDGAGKDNTAQYRRFIKQQSSDGLRNFCLTFPVAARLISEVSLRWIEFVTEFVKRFQNDQRALAIKFNAGLSLGRISNVCAGLSDPHHSGRTVLMVSFSSGQKLVYKPRPLEIDRVYFGLVGELNAHGLVPALRCLGIYEGSGYGWMEFARHSSCLGMPAARRYFSRIGSLARLVHWLRGIDFHRENVVASGEHPILIDLESLAHPLRCEEELNDGSPFTWSFAGSVLRSGLLPLWQERGMRPGRYDNSGFGAPVRQRSLFPTIVWQEINTDQMQWKRIHRFRHHSAHRMRLDGKLTAARDHSATVLSGYRQVARLLRGRYRGRFEALREQIQNVSRRRIKRPTAVYKMLLLDSTRTEHLKAGIERSIEFQRLPFTGGEAEDWKREIASLEGLDVPYFFCSQSDWSTWQQSAPEHIAQERVQEQLVRLSLERKLTLLGNRVHAAAQCNWAAGRAVLQGLPKTA